MGNIKIKTDLRSITLLIVEDGEDIISIMDRTFKMLVKDIYLANNGEEALEQYKKHSPDVVITDIRMPHFSGIKLLKELREEDKETPIFVISAYPQDMTEEENALATAVFEKPIDFIKLLHKLDEALTDK